MKFILIFLFPFLLHSQNTTIDGWKHYGAGMLIGTGAGILTFHLITKERWGISIATGILSGGVAGELKEEVYDRQLELGVPSKEDKVATWKGALDSSVFLCAHFDIHTKRKHPDLYGYSDLYY